MQRNREWHSSDTMHRHGCVRSLPFFEKTLNPKENWHSEALLILGDHSRSVRLERKLLQHEVADIIGVTCTTVVNWEANKTEPVISHMPAITEFLGYCLVEYVRECEAGQTLLNIRIQEGLNVKKMAKRIGVDSRSISAFEEGKVKEKKTFEKIQEYLTSHLLEH